MAAFPSPPAAFPPTAAGFPPAPPAFPTAPEETAWTQEILLNQVLTAPPGSEDACEQPRDVPAGPGDITATPESLPSASLVKSSEPGALSPAAAAISPASARRSSAAGRSIRGTRGLSSALGGRFLRTAGRSPVSTTSSPARPRFKSQDNQLAVVAFACSGRLELAGPRRCAAEQCRRNCRRGAQSRRYLEPVPLSSTAGLEG
jgi:hypothetical protein